MDEFESEGHFLTAPSTLERYRNAYYRSLFPHIGLETRVESGRPQALSLLRERTSSSSPKRPLRTPTTRSLQG